MKAILFTIGAAGIPSEEYPKAGYRNRLDILATEVGMTKHSLERHLLHLEEADLLSKQSTGANRPKLRWVNWRELNAMAAAQRADRDAFLASHVDVGEDENPVLWNPEEFHYEVQYSEITLSGVLSSTALVPRIDPPAGSPLGEPAKTTSSWKR